MNLQVVILAAGRGTRMKSALPKVLHPLAGKPMLAHVIEMAQRLDASAIHVVIGHGSEQVKQQLADYGVNWILQEQQLGTGHAVAQALPALTADSQVLVLYGDVPLTSEATLQRLLAQVDTDALALLTVKLANPTGYGRIVRNDGGEVQAIVEEKEASPAEKQVNEVNTGILAVSAKKLHQWLPTLSSENAQGEYYLTDTIAMAVADNMRVATETAVVEEEVQGVNSRRQLAELERWYQLQQARQLMDRGVSFADPQRFDLRGELTCGEDVFIDVNVVLKGKVSIGRNVKIGPNVMISDATLADDVEIFANTVIEQAVLGPGSQAGPFARIRPGTRLAAKAKVGNFVEIKKANIGEGSKVSHLSYIGDAELGAQVNIGAGTITCNYDGVNKHKTEIADGVFIGSNTALVAPLKVGENATVGAGSTLSKDVEAGSLTLTRAKARINSNWKRPEKQK